MQTILKNRLLIDYNIINASRSQTFLLSLKCSKDKVTRLSKNSFGFTSNFCNEKFKTPLFLKTLKKSEILPNTAIFVKKKIVLMVYKNFLVRNYFKQIYICLDMKKSFFLFIKFFHCKIFDNIVRY